MAMSMCVSFVWYRISQLGCSTGASSRVKDFNSRDKFVTAKLLMQGYRYHISAKHFLNFTNFEDIS